MRATEFETLLDEVRALNLKKGSYALFGSSPIRVREINRICIDIDIIVTRRVWNEYWHKKGWRLHVIKRENRKTGYLNKKHIELYRTWGPGEWDIKQLINSADTICGLQFVKLEYVLAWKRRRGLPKDINDINLINKYLANY